MHGRRSHRSWRTWPPLLEANGTVGHNLGLIHISHIALFTPLHWCQRRILSPTGQKVGGVKNFLLALFPEFVPPLSKPWRRSWPMTCEYQYVTLSQHGRRCTIRTPVNERGTTEEKRAESERRRRRTGQTDTSRGAGTAAEREVRRDRHSRLLFYSSIHRPTISAFETYTVDLMLSSCFLLLWTASSRPLCYSCVTLYNQWLLSPKQPGASPQKCHSLFCLTVVLGNTRCLGKYSHQSPTRHLRHSDDILAATS